MPRIWELKLKSNSPSRLVETWSDLERECAYYDVPMYRMARFLGMSTAHAYRNRKEPDRKLPVPVSLLMSLLTQFPPVWVRVRLLGEVKIVVPQNIAGRQRGFKGGEIPSPFGASFRLFPRSGSRG